jgi:ABC-type dipeptide/oligopeptide/nickel transport system permease component
MPYCVNCGTKIRWRFPSQKLCVNCEMMAKLLGSYDLIIKKRYEKKTHYKNLNNFIRNILLTFFLGIVILFAGLFISYTIFHLLPSDPILAYLRALGISWGEAHYHEIAHNLGFEYNHFFGVYYLPFYRFLENFFTGNYGTSIIYMRNRPVNIFLKETIPYTCVVSIIPIIIGIVLGIIIGRSSAKERDKGMGKPIQVFFIFGILLPILLMFKPMLVLTTAFITWQTRYHIVHRLNEKSLFTNTLFTGRIFGFIFLFYILEDINIFGAVFPYITSGFGALLVISIALSEIWLLSGCLFVVIIIFVSITLISNLIFSYSKWKHKFVDSKKFPSSLMLELNRKYLA